MGDSELDIERAEALVAYLRSAGHIRAEEPEVRVLAGGVSNKTVLVKRQSGERWVLKQALPKLRVAVDWFSDVRRIEREAEGLRHLPSLAPAGSITPLVFEDKAHHLLCMEAVPEPHENWKRMLMEGRLDEDHVRQFAAILGGIHRRSAEREEELRPIFRDRSFFESLRVEPYYQYTGTQVAEARGFIDALVKSIRPLTIVHGDFSPKNVLVREGRLVLLDHEVIHWGDPAFDLGFAMTHLLSKAHHLRDHLAAFARAAELFWGEYSKDVLQCAWAEDLASHAVSHTLGCLLARVAGRSPLEYLDATERHRQKAVVVELMRDQPETVGELTGRFVEGCERWR